MYYYYYVYVLRNRDDIKLKSLEKEVYKLTNQVEILSSQLFEATKSEAYHSNKFLQYKKVKYLKTYIYILIYIYTLSVYVFLFFSVFLFIFFDPSLDSYIS